MPKDKIFKSKKKLIQNFNFGKETTKVFDDMLHRSVPFYEETQRMIREMAAEFAVEGTNVYDLGCSTAATFLEIHPYLPKSVTLVGIDSSKDMLKKAHERVAKEGIRQKVKFLCHDLNKGFPITNASVVVMNLTLQFIRPLHREKAIKAIAAGMNDGGCLILIEKVLSPYSTLNRMFIKFYYDFKKRNGYSELEISQKREALENVLIPYHYDENRELLMKNGFKGCDIFFRWYNFCGMVALK